METIEELWSRWDYLKGALDDKRGCSIQVRDGPATLWAPVQNKMQDSTSLTILRWLGQGSKLGAVPTGTLPGSQAQEASPG